MEDVNYENKTQHNYKVYFFSSLTSITDVPFECTDVCHKSSAIVEDTFRIVIEICILHITYFNELIII